MKNTIGIYDESKLPRAPKKRKLAWRLSPNGLGQPVLTLVDAETGDWVRNVVSLYGMKRCQCAAPDPAKFDLGGLEFDADGRIEID